MRIPISHFLCKILTIDLWYLNIYEKSVTRVVLKLDIFNLTNETQLLNKYVKLVTKDVLKLDIFKLTI